MSFFPIENKGPILGLRVIPTIVQNTANPQNSKISKIARNALNGVSAAAQVLRKVFVVTGLVSVIDIPKYLYRAVKHLSFHKTDDCEKKLDATLKAASNLEKTGGALRAVFGAIVKIKDVAFNVFSLLAPFSLIMSVFSMTSIIGNVRCYKQTKNLINEIDGLFKRSVQEEPNKQLQIYSEILQIIEKKQQEKEDFISTTFCVKTDEFVAAAIAIESEAKEKLSSSIKSEQEEGKEILLQSMEALKHRLRSRKISAVISITASSIAIIGTAVLLGTGSVSLGSSIMGLGGFLSFVCWVQKKAADYRLTNEIKIEKTALQFLFS